MIKGRTIRGRVVRLVGPPDPDPENLNMSRFNVAMPEPVARVVDAIGRRDNKTEKECWIECVRLYAKVKGVRMPRRMKDGTWK